MPALPAPSPNSPRRTAACRPAGTSFSVPVFFAAPGLGSAIRRWAVSGSTRNATRQRCRWRSCGAFRIDFLKASERPNAHAPVSGRPPVSLCQLVERTHQFSGGGTRLAPRRPAPARRLRWPVQLQGRASAGAASRLVGADSPVSRALFRPIRWCRRRCAPRSCASLVIAARAPRARAVAAPPDSTAPGHRGWLRIRAAPSP